jgi:hypothetical protein
MAPIRHKSSRTDAAYPKCLFDHTTSKSKGCRERDQREDRTVKPMRRTWIRRHARRLTRQGRSTNAFVLAKRGTKRWAGLLDVRLSASLFIISQAEPL